MIAPLRVAVSVALLAACAAFASARETAAANAVDPQVFDVNAAERTLLVTFRDRGINRVEVGARVDQYRHRGVYQNSMWSARVAANLARDYGLVPLASWAVTELGAQCVVFLVPEAMGFEQVLARLAGDRRVQIVQRMGVFKTLSRQYQDPYFGLQHSVQPLNLTSIHGRATGRGITVAVIDSGVDLDHPDLAGSVVASENFAGLMSPGSSGDRHGTAVAGIIAARPNNGAGIVGIAPEAPLLALKACWPTRPDALEAVCNSFTLALAVNDAIRRRAKILNLSLTGPHDPLLEALLNTAMDQGIVVVAADPTDTAAVGSRFPATMDRVVAVGDSERAAAGEGRELASNRVLAPGAEILTTLPGATYGFVSGSSFAAAHVTGLVALILQRKPRLGHAELIADLRSFNQGGLERLFAVNVRKP